MLSSQVEREFWRVELWGETGTLGQLPQVKAFDKIEKTTTLPKFFCMHPSLDFYYKWLQ